MWMRPNRQESPAHTPALRPHPPSSAAIKADDDCSNAAEDRSMLVPQTQTDEHVIFNLLEQYIAHWLGHIFY